MELQRTLRRSGTRVNDLVEASVLWPSTAPFLPVVEPGVTTLDVDISAQPST